MSHALLAIQNNLQNSNIFIRSRETVLFIMSFGKKKVTQFSGLPVISVSYLKCHYMYSLEISKTLPSLIFFVRNLAIHGQATLNGQFTLSGQIFNSHILIVVKNEDLKGATEITQMAFQ